MSSSAEAGGSFAASLLATGIAVVFVLALAWVLVRLMRRSMTRTQGDAAIRFVAAIPVGSRERVVVVEADGRRLVLGVAQSQVTLLASRDLADAAPGLNSDDPADATESPGAPFLPGILRSLSPRSRRS